MNIVSNIGDCLMAAILLWTAALAAPSPAMAAEGAPEASARVVFYGEGRVKSRSDESYALVRSRGTSMVVSGNGEQIPIDELKRVVRGDFVWFRDGGKTFVIVDPALLARVEQAWLPYDSAQAALSAERGARREQLRQTSSAAYKQVQQTMRALIDEALAQGKATPFPAARAM